MIELTIKSGVARLVLNRPDKLNALTAQMCRDLLARCLEIEQSNARVVVLSGAGKAFCAGGDIGAWSTLSPETFADHWVRDGHLAFDALARLTVPVIAVLDGHALGGGLELAACADLRIAEEQIKIGQPETGLGIIPGWSGTQRAVRRFGAQVVRRMALLGEVFGAPEGLALGLVDEVVAQGSALMRADEVAQKVLLRGPQATKLTKMLINAADGEDTERVLDALAGRIAAGTSELEEGIAAFHEKRAPNF